MLCNQVPSYFTVLTLKREEFLVRGFDDHPLRSLKEESWGVFEVLGCGPDGHSFTFTFVQLGGRSHRTALDCGPTESFTRFSTAVGTLSGEGGIPFSTDMGS